MLGSYADAFEMLLYINIKFTTDIHCQYLGIGQGIKNVSHILYFKSNEIRLTHPPNLTWNDLVNEHHLYVVVRDTKG